MSVIASLCTAPRAERRSGPSAALRVRGEPSGGLQLRPPSIVVTELAPDLLRVEHRSSGKVWRPWCKDCSRASGRCSTGAPDAVALVGGSDAALQALTELRPLGVRLAQADALIAIGCRLAQGSLYGCPGSDEPLREGAGCVSP